METITTRVVGLDRRQLDEFWKTRLDHAGNTAEPFIDDSGGWPLRCCLRDSQPGDDLVIVAWSPFPWRGPYAEIGPVVLHSRPCEPPAGDGEVPPQFRRRRQILRPYDQDRRIAYEHIRLLEADDDLEAAIHELLAIDEIVVVHARNVLSGCYSFTIERSASSGRSVEETLVELL